MDSSLFAKETYRIMRETLEKAKVNIRTLKGKM